MAGTKIRGITIEIGGDTSGLNKALGSVNSQIKSTQSQLKDVERLLKLDPSNTELLTQKHKLLKEAVTETKDKLKTLKETQDKIDSGKVTTSKEAYDALKREIVSCETSLKDLEKQAAQSNAVLVKTGEAFDKISEKADSAGKKMSVLTGAIAAGGVVAVKTTATFESAMSQVQATMGVTKDSMSVVNGESVNTMDTLNALAKEMGAKTAFSATECAQALNYLALAGYNTQQMCDTLPIVLNLAAAGDMELATASDMVTDAMSALGMGVDQAGKMVDQMSKTASTTNTSVSQLGEGILTIGATAKSIKGGTDELNTALGILANNGIKGAEGGTHLRNIILSLQKPTDAAAAIMESLGVAVYDSEGNMRSLNDILTDLNISMEEMTSEEKTNAIGDIFNKTDLASVNALLANTGDTWSNLQQTIADSGGAAQQMADTQLDNLNGQITILKSQIEGLLIQIGEKILPYIKKTVDGLSGVITWLSGLDSATQNMIMIILLIVAAIGPLLIFIGKMASGVSAIIKVVQVLIPIVSSLNAVLAANPIILIIAGITALIVAIILLYNKCEWFRDGVNAIVGTIVDFAKDVWEKISTFFTETIPNVFDTVIAWFKDNWLGLLLLLVNPFAGAFKLLYDNCEGFRNFVNGFIEKVVDAFTGFVSKIKEKAVSIGTHITDGIEVAIDYIRDLPHKMTEWGKDMIDGFVAGIKSKVSNVENAVIGIGNKIKSFLHFSRPDEGPLRDYETWMPDFIGRMAEQIEQQKGKITNAVQSIAGEMKFTPAIASTSSTTSNTTNVFNGNYKFNDKSDIDYFMNQAALRLKGAR